MECYTLHMTVGKTIQMWFVNVPSEEVVPLSFKWRQLTKGLKCNA